MKIEILNTEVVDLNLSNRGQSQSLRSMIEVHVNFTLDGKLEFINYQTETSYDYQVSCNLGAYQGCNIFDDYESWIADEIAEEVLALSEAQKAYDEYLSDNYILNDDWAGGMDANSVINEMELLSA